MLSEILRFFQSERKYFWLLVAIIVFYSYMTFGPKPRSHSERPSQEMQAFKESEKAWDNKMSREGGFEEFAKRKPALAMAFRLMMLVFAFALIAGVIIGVIWWRRPVMREKWTNTLSPPSGENWPFSYLFKVVMLFMGFGILVSLVMGVISAIFAKHVSENYFMILHTVILNLMCLYLMIKFVRRSGGKWQDLGFHVPATGFFKEIGVGIAGYMAVVPWFAVVLTTLLVIANLIHYEPPAHPLVNVFLEEKKTPFLLFSSVLLATLVGPIFEEIFFRGFCYPIFRNKWGKAWGMVLSAAFFAGVHYSGFAFWPIFILGIALAYVYELRRSLIASIALHVAHNVLFISYFFLVEQIVAVRMS